MQDDFIPSLAKRKKAIDRRERERERCRKRNKGDYRGKKTAAYFSNSFATFYYLIGTVISHFCDNVSYHMRYILMHSVAIGNRACETLIFSKM